MKLINLLKAGKLMVSNNLPNILKGIAIAGVGTTAILAGKGALEADKYLRETEDPEDLECMTLKDKFKKTYKFYIPAFATGTMTVACMLGSDHMRVKKIATITTVATTAEKALIDNRNKIEELFGEKGLRKLDEKLNEEHAATYFNNLDDVYETGHGHVLCCEGYLTGKKFRANPEWVYKCVNDFNAELNAGAALSFNNFLEMLIPSIDFRSLPSHGEELGFNLEINGRLMELSVDSGVLPDTKEPYLIFTQKYPPISNYRDYL